MAWTWQCYTSASFLWPKQVTWSVQIQRVGNSLCTVTKGVGRGEGGRIGVASYNQSRGSLLLRERTRSTSFLRLAVQIWAGAKPLSQLHHLQKEIKTPP